MPTPTDNYAQLRAALGPQSPAIRQTAEILAILYRQTQHIPPVANSYQAWVASRPPRHDTQPQTFIRHTAQSLLLRLIAYRFLTPRNPNPTNNNDDRNLRDIILGDWFAAQNWNNLLPEDLFSWPYYPLSMNLGKAPEALAAAQTLLNALQPFDFTTPPPNLPSALLSPPNDDNPTTPFPPNDDNPAIPIPPNTGNPTTPFPPNDANPFTPSPPKGWNTRRGTTPPDPQTPTLAPHCGPGATLAQVVRAAVQARQAQNQDPLTALMETSHQFLAMTPDPLDASAAAVNFLFALGPLSQQPHPPILIPVYQADAARIPTPATPDTNDPPTYTITLPGIAAPPTITLPEKVAADPLYLDWLLSRLPNYQRGAVLRLHAQPQDAAIQEVLNAWYNYLTSPKARTPIPQPLSPPEADTMVETARALITAYIQGSGPAPLHQARNAPAPLFPTRRPYPQTI